MNPLLLSIVTRKSDNICNWITNIILLKNPGGNKMVLVKVNILPCNEIVYINPSTISSIKPVMKDMYTICLTDSDHRYTVNESNLNRILSSGEIKIV